MFYSNEQYKTMAHAIRFLSIDAVERAKSGHPGMPMGMADIAVILFSEFLKFSPSNPNWLNRDRFILSNGHGSMLQYSLLHLFGYDLSIEDIKNFRQLDSKTPGHPEYGHTIGVETTTGPLGQGLANAIGMAIAAKKLASKAGNELINHKIYTVVGDGCLMEGISHEASSLAGHLKLNNLVVIFDDNNISIDGATSLAITEDVLNRYKSYGFDVEAINGHDHEQIRNALTRANKSDKPYFIAAKTKIGYGSPNKECSESSHGSPLGKDEVELTRKNLGWSHEAFSIPEEVRKLFADVTVKKEEELKIWQNNFEKAETQVKEYLNNVLNNNLLSNLGNIINKAKDFINNNRKPEATRKSSGNVLSVIAEELECLIGGSADLTTSNETKPKYLQPITKDDFSGRYVYYGVREHAMGAIMNGLALYGGIIPYSGTFLVFSDYMRPSIRLAALMKQKVIYVFTHDSIGLGEDGPTHQPVEHLAVLRAIPGLQVLRPCDQVETLECWQMALEYQGPTALILTRQNVTQFRNEFGNKNLSELGAYVINGDENCETSIFASGSEVGIAIEAKNILETQHNIKTKVFSVPSLEKFKASGKINNLKGHNFVVEAGLQMGWEGITKDSENFIGMSSFGASAPYEKLYEHFGITTNNVVKKVLEKLGR